MVRISTEIPLNCRRLATTWARVLPNQKDVENLRVAAAESLCFRNVPLQPLHT